MAEQRLDGLRVIQRTADAATVGRTDHHGDVKRAVGAVAYLGRLIDDLVNAGWMKSANFPRRWGAGR